MSERLNANLRHDDDDDDDDDWAEKVRKTMVGLNAINRSFSGA